MAQPPRQVSRLALVPSELYEAEGRVLFETYERAERRIVNLLAEKQGTRPLTRWGKAFQQQQLARIRAIMADLSRRTEAWAVDRLPTLYQHGMAVADNYMMHIDDAAEYARLRTAGVAHDAAVAQINAATGAPPPHLYRGLLEEGLTPEAAIAKLEKDFPGRWGPGGISKAAAPGFVTPMDLSLTAIHQGAIAEVVAANYNPLLTNVYRQETKWNKPWRKLNLETMEEAFTSGLTRVQTQKRILEGMQERGLMEFTDSAGRKWPPKRYANMVARTTSAEASREATYRRLTERGQDLVRVSSHGADDECGPWEGVVLSMGGKTPGYPTVADAESTGLFHPNCGHTPVPYIAGLTGPVEKRTESERKTLVAEKRVEVKEARRRSQRRIRQEKAAKRKGRAA